MVLLFALRDKLFVVKVRHFNNWNRYLKVNALPHLSNKIKWTKRQKVQPPICKNDWSVLTYPPFVFLEFDGLTFKSQVRLHRGTGRSWLNADVKSLITFSSRWLKVNVEISTVGTKQYLFWFIYIIIILFSVPPSYLWFLLD